VAEVIPLRRIKLIVAATLAARFEAVEKAPPKTLELRLVRSLFRMAGRERDALAGMAAPKFAHRARHAGKLRLFRLFKLFGQLKAQAAPDSYRPVAERLRARRWMLRL
jgi:hypothetical protein